MIVTLTANEMIVAAMVGCRRRISSMIKKTDAVDEKRVCERQPSESLWESDIEGAAGEMAVAKAWHCYWPVTVDTYKLGDDVDGFQVRSTTHPNGCLVIRSDDDDADVFVLVTGKCPRFDVIGWMRGGAGKQEQFLKYKNDRYYRGVRDVFFVPQNHLFKTPPNNN